MIAEAGRGSAAGVVGPPLRRDRVSGGIRARARAYPARVGNVVVGWSTPSRVGDRRSDDPGPSASQCRSGGSGADRRRAGGARRDIATKLVTWGEPADD